MRSGPRLLVFVLALAMGVPAAAVVAPRVAAPRSAARGLAPARAPTSALLAPRRVELAVVGGGPVGLATAIEARLQGAASVVVLEKRGPERARTQNLALLPGSLDNLARLGLPVVPGRNATAVLSPDGERRPVEGDARRAGVETEPLLKGGFAAFMSINTLERELMARARRMGVALRFGAAVEGVEPGPDGVALRAGERTVLAEHAVLTDGARSPNARALGLGARSFSEGGTRLLNGVFRARGDGRLEFVSDGELEALAQGGPRASAIIKVPAGVEFSDRDAMTRFFLERARKVGFEGPLLMPPLLFDVREEGVERHSAAGRIFVAGDAARRTHPYTGLGVNLGLRDAMRVGRLLAELRGVGERRRARLVRRFEREMRRVAELSQAYSRALLDQSAGRR